MNLVLSFWRLFFAPIYLALRGALQRSLSRAEAALSAGEGKVLIPPKPAKYTGSSWLRRPRGDGVIALSEEGVWFWPLLGSPIHIPRQEIEGVQLARWFRGYRRAGSEHLVLRLTGGRRIGFIVTDTEAWVRMLTSPSRSQRKRENSGGANGR